MIFASQLFLGIDGGGSQTRALAIDSRSRPIASGLASGCNPHNIGFAEAGNRINEAVLSTLETLDANEIASIFCGIAGIGSIEEQTTLADTLSRFSWTRNANLKIDHDLSIAYEAGIGQQAGICVIAGTGASCIAKNDRGEFHKSHNRLPNGDEPGSGYAIGFDAIKAGIASVESETRKTVASLTRSVMELANRGNVSAREIIDENTTALVRLIARIHAQAHLGDAFPIVITGGLGSAETLYRILVLEKLSALFPKATIRYPRMTSVEAAAQLAFQLSTL